jgi:prophage regulatory protein
MSSKFLRVQDVCALIGLGRTTIYTLEKQGRFPRRIPLVGKAVAWQESEVKEWMEARLAARGQSPSTNDMQMHGVAK